MNNGLCNGTYNGLANGLQSDPYINRVASEIGTIFSDSFSRASVGANYTISGGASWICDGTKLTTSGGTGVYTSNLGRSLNPTCLEKHVHTVDFKMTSVPSGTSYGIGVGVLGTNSNDRRSYVLRCIMTNDAISGKTYLDTAQGGSTTFTNRKISTSSVTVSQNDLFRLVVERDMATIKWTLTNVTTGSFYSDSFTFSYAFASGLNVHVVHSTGNFTMFSFGGTFEVTNWTVSSKEYVNPKTLFIGDSITYGIFADDVKNRWATKCMGETHNIYNVSGGGSDKTNEVLTKIKELVNMKPKYAVLMIGGNDYAFGVADATAKANYESIVLRLKSAGITVIHCLATPRNTLDLRAFNNYLLSKYGSTDVVIKGTYNHLWDSATSFNMRAIYNSGDGVHPNALGHSVIANAVYQEVPYIR